jgi:CHAD domain-containing protein
MASNRAKRAAKPPAVDRLTQITAGSLLGAGAALAGKSALDRVGSDSKTSGPSRSYRLKRKEEPADGVRRIAGGRAETALEDLQGAAQGGDPASAVHAARKDLKKLRSALRLVRAEIGETQFQIENTRYRDAARQLSASRDAEVKLRTLAALGKRFEAKLPEKAVGSWIKLLADERDELDRDTALAAQIAVAMGQIEIGRAEIRRWRLRADSWSLIQPGIERSYKRGRREMRRVRTKRREADVHNWRKRVKDLWYQLRIVGRMWPALIDETADQAHELADLLGDHHDLAILRKDLKARERVTDQKSLESAIERRQDEILDDALQLGALIYAEKPKALNSRLSAYWKSWRQG